jgi:hypothetical protein
MRAAECSWTSLRLPPNRRRSATVVNTSADRRRCSCQTTFPRAAKLIFASCRFTLDEHAATSAFIALFLTFFGNFSETYRRITGSSRKNFLRGHFLTVLLSRRDYWTVDVPVANAVRECVDPGTNQALRVFEVEDVRNHPESSLVPSSMRAP